MSKERLSKLQKSILVTLFTEGKTIEPAHESVNPKDEKKIAELKEQGYQPGELIHIGHNDPTVPGNVFYKKEFVIYELSRSAILFEVYSWQEYNAYKEGWYGFSRWRGKPDDYDKKQVTLTKSLRNLCGKRLVDLMSSWLGGISVYDKELANKLGIEVQDFESDRKEALEQVKQKHLKEKESDPRIGTFEEWFDEPIRDALSGGWTTKRIVWEGWHNSRIGRNARKIRLTDEGITKAEELLKVKSRTPVQDLTLRKQLVS